MHRPHGSGRARAIGGPGGLAWAIGAELGRGDLVDQLAGALDQGGAAKPAKLPTQGRKCSCIRRLAAAFQHHPSNMPRQARREPQFSAIVAAPGAQLLDPAELERAGRCQARDRRPKLSPRIPTRTLQIAISGL